MKLELKQTLLTNVILVGGNYIWYYGVSTKLLREQMRLAVDAGFSDAVIVRGVDMNNIIPVDSSCIALAQVLMLAR